MKKTLKKVIALALVAMLAFALCSCGSTKSGEETSSEVVSSASSTEFKIGVIQYISHPSLDNCFAGIDKALKASGLNYKIDKQTGSDANADADCATYAKNMVAQNYDMIIAIATPAATAAYAATEGTKIPVIFCAVNDPVAAKLVESNEVPGGLCTGTSDVLDLSSQVEMIKKFQPDVKTIGVLYTQSESNSISNLKLFKEVCEKLGVAVEATGIQNDADIPAAAASLCEKVDCINNFTDNKIVNNLSVLLDAANSANIPVYGSEIEQVKNGCLASVSIDYVGVGEDTGKMAADVLGGADITTMPVKTTASAAAVYNTEVLAQFGLAVPEEYKEAETVVTNK